MKNKVLGRGLFVMMLLVSTVEAGRFEEKITPEEVQELMEAVEIAEVLAPAVESGVRAVKEAAERGEMPPAGMTKQGWGDWLKSKGSSAWAGTKSGFGTAKEKAAAFGSAAKKKLWDERTKKEIAAEAAILAAGLVTAGGAIHGAATRRKATPNISMAGFISKDAALQYIAAEHPEGSSMYEVPASEGKVVTYEVFTKGVPAQPMGQAALAGTKHVWKSAGSKIQQGTEYVRTQAEAAKQYIKSRLPKSNP